MDGGGVRLSIAVQAHPLRAPSALRIAAELAGEPCWDPDPDGQLRSAWRTYRRALAETPPWATHRLIVQDDVRVCRGCRQAAERAAALAPDRVICLYVGGAPRAGAARLMRGACEGRALVDLGTIPFCPVVATMWPVRLVPRFLAWVDEQRWPADFRADDEIAGRFLLAHGLTPLATVPSLVQHPDTEPSLVGRRARGGEDATRVAALWAEDCREWGQLQRARDP
ncbi:MAG: hypothetical protein QN122_12155 [Armatimonadota bacterium]|nr:hypothetical protein [Armatimonadota bacterium]